MSRVRRNVPLLVVPLLGLGLALLSTASWADYERKSLKADAHGQVDIGNVAGNVQVHGWDKDEVEVGADLGDAQKLEFSNDGGNRTQVRVVAVRGTSGRDRGRNSGHSVDLVVKVPQGSSLSVRTVSADQNIREVRGSQRLQSVNGMIDTDVWDEDLQIKTISGDVHVDGHNSTNVADINTVSGLVVLRGLAGEVEVETVSGDIQVRMGELSRGRIRTTNGSVDWRSRLTAESRLDAEAINGDLRFRLQKPLDAQFDIETFNGEIENCFGQESKRAGAHGPGRTLRFVRGKGGARVGIQTMNGGIDVCDD